MIEKHSDVILNPDLYVDSILNMGFYDMPDGDTIFKNVCKKEEDEFYQFLLNNYPDYDVSLNFVRQSPLGQKEPNYIHTDEMMGDLTAILYLNKEHPKSYGTTLYFNNKSIEAMYLAKYNSAIIFDSKKLHSRNLEENFGEGDNSRLVQVAFLNLKKNNE